MTVGELDICNGVRVGEGDCPVGVLLPASVMDAGLLWAGGEALEKNFGIGETLWLAVNSIRPSPSKFISREPRNVPN